MTALVLQARLDSSRLSEKAMLPLGGRPLILRAMQALSFVSCDQKILACPEDSERVFAPLAEEAGFEIAVGPKEDVLERFCLAIKRCGARRIIRATGDNPFVFADAANALCEEADSLGADYAGFSALPYGAGVECVLSEALFRAQREAQAAPEREHVCPYLYSRPDIFRLHRPLAPIKWQGADIRITVDTGYDYHRAKALYEKLSALPANEQCRGENIIAAYRKLFGGGNG